MSTKNLLIPICLLCSMMAFGHQEKQTASLDRVTVFMNGAQVERSKSMNLIAGEQVITFTGLSPYTETKSMQVKAKGLLTVLGISFKKSYPDSLLRVRQLREAEQKVKDITKKQKELQAQQEVVSAQLEMVKTNSSVGNRTAVTPLANIKELNNYYAEELLALKKRSIAINDELSSIDEELAKRQQTVDSISRLKLNAVTEVEVKVFAPQAGQADFTLSYYVKNAGWFPTYDIRSEGITQPLKLSYKANVFQNTKEDWQNTSVTLSSANPNRSNIAPQLRTYWLDFGTRAPQYNQDDSDGSVSGIVTDEEGEPIIGAAVQIVGTQIGAITDFEGRYSLTLPQGKRQLRFSYVGFIQQTRTVNAPSLNVVMKEDQAALQEVVVVGYGTNPRAAGKRSHHPERVAGVAVEREPDPTPTEESSVIAVDEQKALFGYEFEIKQPLTLLSNGKTTVTEIGRYELAADYQYKGIPRADKDAFLMANATDWQKLSLLEGEANVYFENSFVGKTILDPMEPSDTLHFSLGRDNGIRMSRTKIADKSNRRLLASTQEQTMTWQITVKNTRKEAVKLTLQDQLPVSKNSSITVTTEELSGGELDKEQGIVSWLLQLQPGEQRELTVQYRVKYPKNRRLVVE